MEEQSPFLVHAALAERVIGAAITVHRELGPGLLESAYEACLAKELFDRNLGFARQVDLPVIYKGQRIDCGYRMDMVVNNTLLLELKAVEKVNALHEAQLLTYMRLASLPVGLIINFNVRVLKDGIVRRALTQSPLRDLGDLRGTPSLP
jgi:GxxExxY protein